MPKHNIECVIPKSTVYNTDVVHSVDSDKKALGKLKVSRGNVEWTPAGNSANHYVLTWEKFAEFMKKYGTKKYTGKAKA